MMWLHLRLIPARGWGSPLPVPGGFVQLPQRAPQRTMIARRPAKLLRQFAHEIVHLHVATRLCDLMLNHLDKGEVLEHGYDIRKRLVERKSVRLCHFHKTWVNSVQNCVGGLVGDYVMRETAEHDTARVYC